MIYPLSKSDSLSGATGPQGRDSTSGRIGSVGRVRLPSAFSLIELLVTVTLMTVVIFALYAVFNQTQKAMRGSMTQVDVMEGGRAAMNLIMRDVEQLPYPRLDGVNLFVRYSYPNSAPLLQKMDQAPDRTNYFQELFFLSRSNLFWMANGYYVASPTNASKLPNSPLAGTLYRFSAPYPTNDPTIHLTSNHLANLNDQFIRAMQGNPNYAPFINPVVQGVVHFQWRAYDVRGNLMTNRLVFFGRGVPPFYTEPPAYLELELGVLETQTFEQYKSFLDAGTARQFLERQAGKVHLFRQRIPIRSNLR